MGDTFTNIDIDFMDLQANLVDRGLMPGQCQAFLTSNEEFTWFVEEWTVVDSVDVQSGLPSVNLTNKKVYPAKIEGLSLPLYNFLNINNNPTLPVTVRWREGLIRHGNKYDTVFEDTQIPCYRPGFGQTILSDLQRPLKSKTVQCNSLNLINGVGFQNLQTYNGPLGRLMSMAFYVDPALATKYDTSQNKKKKESLNSQDYEEIPTYPTYDTWVDDSGGY
jgi:hypothetical protein